MKASPHYVKPLAYPYPCRLSHACAGMLMSVLLILAAGVSYADTNQPLTPSDIRLEKLTSKVKSGYGYKLQYLVPIPIKSFWRFKMDFTGSSLWVHYLWYGGMKSTLTRVAKREQKTALEYARSYMVARTY